MNCNHEKANVGDRFCPECGDPVVWVPKVHTEDPDCPPNRVYSGGAKAPKTTERKDGWSPSDPVWPPPDGCDQ